MKTELLDFDYPEELVATRPQNPSRVLLSAPNSVPVELTIEDLLNKIQPNDIVILNDTKVQKRRLKTESGLDVLFVEAKGERLWQVLFPAKKVKEGEVLGLPAGLTMTLKEKGIPQLVEVSSELTPSYFEEYGEYALPPYIEKRRKQLEMAGESQASNRYNDEEWYQTQWAEHMGSCAAPTASLHFKKADWEGLKKKGIAVETITLHVGMGTFLPIQSESVADHKMHTEFVSIPAETLQKISHAKGIGGRVWAVGTTVMRALEGWAQGHLDDVESGGAEGVTDIFIRPGHKFQVVSGLMTNFHQPKTTLMALVGAFAGVFRTKEVYEWAILNRFKLFSYGDLSVWLPE